jgi:hypothetical protein
MSRIYPPTFISLMVFLLFPPTKTKLLFG